MKEYYLKCIIFKLILLSVFLGATSCEKNELVPDLPGKTIKGIVHCNGTGIPDVVVSDGYEVTTTDSNGVYYLSSKKEHGYVFVTIPGDYEVNNKKGIPQFFQYLDGNDSVERKDFSLSKTDNKKHVVLAMADWHLADKYGDLSQYNEKVVPDVNSVIAQYESQGIRVYGLTLGDMSYERYWESTKFKLPEYLNYMEKINCSFFNVMGNHDNDPYKEGDWLSESTYKKIIGPTYYSFNLGDVHYVVLDNIEYVNTGGAPGKIGKRNYNGVIVPDQLAWLQKDLSTIKNKNTPIIIAMHIPLCRPTEVTEDGSLVSKVSLDNGTELINSISEFSNVHILSGHKHSSQTMELYEGLMEHNIAAVCAAWWRTGEEGFAGNHICRDGSPGGYGVWEINGNDIEWYFKGIGFDRDYQFRSYDLNTAQITNEKYAPSSLHSPIEYAGEYALPNDKNEVLINIWGYDSKWKIDVKEQGKSLLVKRVVAEDPLFIISHVAQYHEKGLKPYKKPGLVPNMFKVKASNPESDLEITVTDRFGNVYSKTMSRPDELKNLLN